jgi:hypothetical protein
MYVEGSQVSSQEAGGKGINKLTGCNLNGSQTLALDAILKSAFISPKLVNSIA